MIYNLVKTLYSSYTQCIVMFDLSSAKTTDYFLLIRWHIIRQKKLHCSWYWDSRKANDCRDLICESLI